MIRKQPLRKDEVIINGKVKRAPPYKVREFLEIIRIADNNIQLKDIKVYRTPQYNIYVEWKHKNLMTVNGWLLTDREMEKINKGEY